MNETSIKSFLHFLGNGCSGEDFLIASIADLFSALFVDDTILGSIIVPSLLILYETTTFPASEFSVGCQFFLIELYIVFIYGLKSTPSTSDSEFAKEIPFKNPNVKQNITINFKIRFILFLKCFGNRLIIIRS